MTTIKIWNLELFSAWFFDLNRMRINSGESRHVCVPATHFRSIWLSKAMAIQGKKTPAEKNPQIKWIRNVLPPGKLPWGTLYPANHRAWPSRPHTAAVLLWPTFWWLLRLQSAPSWIPRHAGRHGTAGPPVRTGGALQSSGIPSSAAARPYWPTPSGRTQSHRQVSPPERRAAEWPRYQGRLAVKTVTNRPCWASQ